MNILKMTTLISALLLSGCGSVAVIGTIPLPAEAQRAAQLTNVSAPSGPQNVVTATAQSGLTAYVQHVSPNTPIAGQATIIFSSNVVQVGQSVTLVHTPPATAANDGTYMVQSAVSPPANPWYVVNCVGCVQYDDEKGYPPPNGNCDKGGINYGPCSLTFDGFPNLVTDTGGKIHLLYVEGVGDQGATFPDSVYEKTSTDGGATWSSSTLLFQDTSNSCHNDSFVPTNNCRYMNLAAGLAPNGNIIAFAADTGDAGIPLGVFWRVWDGIAWGASTQLSNPAPDGSAWLVPYGNIHQYGTKLAVFVVSNNFNTYLVWSCDNGLNWNQPSCNNGARFIAASSVPEGDFFSAGGNNILGFFRMPLCATLATVNCGSFLLYKSTDLGATWTSTRTNINATNAVTSWELVSPWVLCPASINGQCTLFWGERNLVPVQQNRLVAVSFDPSTAMANPTSFPLPQVLFAGGVNPTDCCYISASTTSTGILITWYQYPYNNAGWKLFTQTAQYFMGTGIITSRTPVVEGVVE